MNIIVPESKGNLTQDFVNLCYFFSTRTKKKESDFDGHCWIFEMRNCNDTINGEGWEDVFRRVGKALNGTEPVICFADGHWINIYADRKDYIK